MCSHLHTTLPGKTLPSREGFFTCIRLYIENCILYIAHCKFIVNTVALSIFLLRVSAHTQRIGGMVESVNEVNMVNTVNSIHRYTEQHSRS